MGYDSDVPADALLSRALSYIAHHLHDPVLGPDQICRSLGISRSRLYRAFTAGGGVAAAIRDARLDRAYELLASGSQNRENISTVMVVCGFRNAPTFSRVFRRRFAVSPRDVLNHRETDSP